jgi:hypothetical protein
VTKIWVIWRSKYSVRPKVWNASFWRRRRKRKPIKARRTVEILRSMLASDPRFQKVKVSYGTNGSAHLFGGVASDDDLRALRALVQQAHLPMQPGISVQVESHPPSTQAAGKAGIALLLALVHHWPDPPEPLDVHAMANRRIAGYIFVVLFALGAANVVAASRVDVHKDTLAIATLVRRFKCICGRLPINEEGLKALIERPPNVAAWRQLLTQIPLDPWSHPDAVHGSGES